MASFLRSGRMHDMFTQPRHAARSSAAHRACRAATWTGGRSPLSSSVRPDVRCVSGSCGAHEGSPCFALDEILAFACAWSCKPVSEGCDRSYQAIARAVA